MTLPMSTTAPEVGQLVEVRRRRYVVNDVIQSSLQTSGLSLTSQARHHLVTLTSLDDEGLGEELQVIWELEPGAHAYDESGLPDIRALDSPHRLDAFLNAVRWGAIASVNDRTLQAPFRSGIEIEDYQLDPLVRALQMPRANLLIADDVGLGKTIEAGLVVQEMILRYRVQRVLVVCPAALQIHWREQMRDKFGLDFRIVDSRLMKTLRRRRGIHVNPWTHFPRLITSIDFLKRDRPMRLFRETLPGNGAVSYPRKYDMLIVDEAHNVAPAGSGRYAIDSLRTAAIRTIAPHFEHRLFVTATPHNGYKESFSALLELLDNQRFARGVDPDPEQLARVMVRRLKSDLPPDWDGSPRFPERRIQVLEVRYSEEEHRIHGLLQRYTRLRREHVADAVERTASEFVLKLLKKRLFSSPAAFAHTLAQHKTTVTEPRRRDASKGLLRRPSPGVLRSMLEAAEESYNDDQELEEALDSALSTSGRLLSDLTREERDLLEEMSAWAETAANRPDSKARALLSWLHEHIRPGGAWSEERVIIFTEYRDTQKWLQTLLAGEGLAGNERLMTLYGGMAEEECERIKAAFQADPKGSPVRILLATDAASEGIDLQRHCHQLIHYEIPWNPNRMEQRNGRIDRHGQRRNPLIYHFVPSGYGQQTDAARPVGDLEGDLEFLMRAVRKVEQIREDLGRVGPVIADQVTEAMLGERRHLDTTAAERQAEPVRRLLRFQQNLAERIQRLHEQLRETVNTLDLTPENVQDAVETALELAGQPPLIPAEVEGIWPDPTGSRHQCPVFRLPPLTGAWAECSEGLEHPHTGAVRPIVFDHRLARNRDDVVLAHLNHKLVQMSLRLLRAELWRRDGTAGLHRVTARIAPDAVLAYPAVIAHARLLIVGGDSHRLHEEIIEAGGVLRAGRFRRMNVGEVREALATATDRQPGEGPVERLRAIWPDVVDALLLALDRRTQERAQSLMVQVQRQAEKEVADMTAILQELAEQIEEELDEPEYEQLELFSTSEREQYRRNRAALRARLDQIPEEIEQEAAAIRARYQNPQARRFPLAITFLVPERLAM